MRGLMRYLATLAVGFWLLAATAHADTPVPPLSTDGAQIVDATGRTAILQGVNWFGFETSAHVVHGLWTRDYRDVLAQIRAAGFNTIRLPFSLEALDADTTTGIDFSGGKNGPLRGRTPLQALDTIIAAAAREHLLVLLDNHSAVDDGYQQPLWYGDGGYTEDDWVAAWRRLATRYAGQANVIGADLKNEPHGPATWGTGGATDWRRAAERAGSAITAIAPHWLIVVEGIEGHAPGQRLGGHWWGGNLEGVRRAPVRLPRPHRLVYSPHEYGPGVFPQPWFEGLRVAEVLGHRWETGFGFLVEQGIAPVLVGEWGGREVGLDTVEGRWQRQFMDYLARMGISWTYWALNPDSGDTGGVLRDDWRSLDADKARLLRQLMRREPVAFGARTSAGASPARDATPTTQASAPLAPDPGPTTRTRRTTPMAPTTPTTPTTPDAAPHAAGADACADCRPRAAPFARTTTWRAPAFRWMRTIEPPNVPAIPAPGAPTAESGSRVTPRRAPGGTNRPASADRAPELRAPDGERPDPAVSRPSPDAASGDAVRLVIDTRWDSGWCGHVEVTPRADASLATRTLRLGLPAGTVLTQSWNANQGSSVGAVTLRLPGWARAAPGAPYTATGVCATGSGEPQRIVLR